MSEPSNENGSKPKPKILCVDDEPRVLEGLQQRLRRRYDVRVAGSGEKGLEVVDASGPFAVIISDMRMPGMDGAAFLEKVAGVAPDSVRMLLTGYADVESATQAVNRGRIFRFLTKPCPPDELSAALSDAVRQYELLTVEKDVLEQTLRGVVEVLTETLSLVNPAAFSRANRIRRIVRRFSASFPEIDAWELEVAGMLSQIGLVTLPGDVVERWIGGAKLSISQKQMVLGHPAVGADLVEQIPRLKTVAEIIRLHTTSYEKLPEPEKSPLGARILKAVVDYERLVSTEMEPGDAVAALKSQAKDYDPDVLAKLAATAEGFRAKLAVKEVTAKQLVVGMLLHKPAKTKHGMTVVPDGNEVTGPMLKRLRNFAAFNNLEEPLLVMTPE